MLFDDAEWSAPKERRESQRVPADAPAVLLGAALGRVSATVTDLSRTGCRVRTRLRCRAGDGVVLRIGAIEPKAVTIAWAADGEMGLASRSRSPGAW